TDSFSASVSWCTSWPLSDRYAPAPSPRRDESSARLSRVASRRVASVRTAFAAESGGVASAGAAGPGVAADVGRILGVDLAVLGSLGLLPVVLVLDLERRRAVLVHRRLRQ